MPARSTARHDGPDAFVSSVIGSGLASIVTIRFPVVSMILFSSLPPNVCARRPGRASRASVRLKRRVRLIERKARIS